MCCPLVFEFSVGIGGFVIGLGQISFFFSINLVFSYVTPGDTGDHSGDGSHNIIYVVEEPKVVASSTLYPIAELHYS